MKLSNIDNLENFIAKNDIDTVFVDIDDTLYDYEYAHKKSLELCYEKFLVLYKNATLKDFKSDYRSCRNKVTNKFKNTGSSRSRILAFQMLFEGYGLNNAYVHALDFEDNYWKYLTDNIKSNIALIKVLKRLHKQNLKICALSDMQVRYQVKKIKKLDLDKILDYLVTSEEYGIEKPDKGIFEYALNKTSSEASRSIMIGDNMQKDILGARDIGMHALHERFTYK